MAKKKTGIEVKDRVYKAREVGELFFYALYKCTANWHVCKLHARTVRKLLNDLKTDYTDYTLNLRSSELIHFLNSHFNEKRSDQRSITFKDIEKIGDVVNYYTRVSLGNRPRTIVFERENPDGCFVLVCTIEAQAKRLSGLSFRIKT